MVADSTRRSGFVSRLATVWIIGFAAVAAAAPIDDYNLAVSFFQKRRWPLAEETTRDFLNNNPDHEKAPLARLYLGQSLAQQQKYEQSRTVFREFLEKHPQHAEQALARYRVGESSYFLGDADSAIQELGKFLSDYPDERLAPWARKYLGEARLSKQQYREAAEAFAPIAAKAPNANLKFDAIYGLARSVEPVGQVERARELYKQVSEANTRRAPEALFALGSLDYAAGEFADARDVFDRLEQQFPGSSLLAQATLNSGFASYQLGDFDKARARFEAAAKADAADVVPKYWLALTQHAEGDFANAAPQFEELLDGPNLPQALSAKAMFYAGDSYLRMEDYAKAADLLSDLAKRYPDSEVAADALHEATEAAARLDDFDRVQALHEEFLKRYEKSAVAKRQRLLVAQNAIEVVQDDQGNAAARVLARTSLEPLIEAGGSLSSRARLELARYYQVISEPESALKAVAPLLSRDSSDEVVANAQTLAASLLLDSGEAERAAQLARRVLNAPNADGRTAAQRVLIQAEAERRQWDTVQALLNDVPAGEGRETLLLDVAETAFDAAAWSFATSWFSEVATNSSPPASAVSGLAYSLFQSERFAEAAEAFNTLEQRAVGNRELASAAAWMHGLSLQRAGETVQAQRVFEAGAATFAVDPNSSVDSGETLTAAETTIVTNAYQMAKQAARIARDAGETDRANRYYEVGVQQLRRLPSEKRGDLDKLVHEWALLAYENEQFDRSDELFRVLLSETPNSAYADDAKLYLAESDFFAGRVEQAATAFRELARNENADDYVRDRAASLLLDISAEMEDWSELRKVATRYLQRPADQASRLYATFRLGEAQLRLKEYEPAITALQEARTLAKQATTAEDWYSTIWVFLAEAAIQQKQYALVDAVASEFAEQFPNSPYDYQIDEIVGRSFKNRARFDDAREALERVVDSESGRRTETAAKSQLLIAETYLLERNHAEAMKAYLKVYVNYAFPEYQAPALFQAATCDEALKNWSAAADSYETLIAEFPGTDYAADAVGRLETVRSRLPR